MSVSIARGCGRAATGGAMTGPVPGPGPAGMIAGCETSSMRKPHAPQKRKPGGTAELHCGQLRGPLTAAGAGAGAPNPPIGTPGGTPGGGPPGPPPIGGPGGNDGGG